LRNENDLRRNKMTPSTHFQSFDGGHKKSGIPVVSNLPKIILISSKTVLTLNFFMHNKNKTFKLIAFQDNSY
jgi:hypothetical protein